MTRYFVEPLLPPEFVASVPAMCPLVQQLICGANDTLRPDYDAHSATLRRLAAAAANTDTQDADTWARRVCQTTELVQALHTRIALCDVDLRKLPRRGRPRQHANEARWRVVRARETMAGAVWYAHGRTFDARLHWGAAAQHALYSLGRAMRELEALQGHPFEYCGAYPPETARMSADVLALVARLCAPAAELAQ